MNNEIGGELERLESDLGTSARGDACVVAGVGLKRSAPVGDRVTFSKINRFHVFVEM